MATILENMTRRKAELAADPDAMKANIAAAIAAMHNGIASGAWKDYMRQFATDGNDVFDPDQLKRLTGEDGTLGDPILNRKRGYMVGNSMCGMTSGDRFLNGVPSIDNGVSGAVCTFESACPQEP